MDRRVAGVRPRLRARARDAATIHLLSTWDEGVPDDIPHEHLYGISFNSQTFLDGAAASIDGRGDGPHASPPTR